MYLNNTNCVSMGKFEPDYCKKLISLCDTLKMNEAKIQDGNGKNRSSKVAWIKQNDTLYNDMNTIINKHNESAGWNFDLVEFEPFQYTIYEEGDHYDWHIDSHTKPYDNGFIRKISFTLILNEDYEGGEFELATPTPKGNNQNQKFTGKFTTGTIISFPSFVWHKVHKVTKGTRKVLVGWIVGPSFA
jgi:PKHD-type hydroxylase|tara:strand:- start:1142 stop:1702 length:561 start_codon:yes stop_codon:yes gene_type:complete